MSSTTLVLFHMIGCGHCDALMPTWDEVSKSFPSSLKIEASEASISTDLKVDSDKLMKWKAENVRGYPTIVKVQGGNIIEYDGERTKQSILDFVEKRGGKRRQNKKRSNKKRCDKHNDKKHTLTQQIKRNKSRRIK